ncbi:MAG: B12-binding domain-containing radical SAM protein [bacterium]
MTRLVLVNHWLMEISNKPPLGLGYLAAYLKRYLDFHNIAIINAGHKAFEKIRAARPEVVGFTAYSANYFDVVELMKRVKAELGLPIILGGPHITCLPHKLSQYADIGVIGEGEETLRQLMRLFLEDGEFKPSKLSAINGIVYRENGGVKITPTREPIIPLDRIPFPDRELLDIHRFLRPTPFLKTNQYIRGTSMLSSRGCPFKCIYCQVRAKWGNIRLHSAERVADEIELLVKRYKVEGIYFADDLFATSHQRIKDIIDGMKRREILGNVQFALDLRANQVTEKLIELLKKMGVVRISLGLESGSERILRYLKGENVTVKQNRRAVEIANQHGIGCYCCFMIGAPPETKADIRMTQRLIQEILDRSTKNICQVNVTTPFPGTELWDYAVEKGLVSEDTDWRQFSFDPRLAHHQDFYINEHIDFEEFQRIVRETVELARSRWLKSIVANFSLRYVRRAFTHPKLAYKIVRDYLKHRNSIQ